MYVQDSLFELLQYGQIPPSLVTDVLQHYDRAVNEALATRVNTKVNFHSEKLSTYRFCDNVWTFLLKVSSIGELNLAFCHEGASFRTLLSASIITNFSESTSSRSWRARRSQPLSTRRRLPKPPPPPQRTGRHPAAAARAPPRRRRTKSSCRRNGL